MIKVLNVMTGGLRREGITTTQLVYMKNLDKSDIAVDIAAVHDDVDDVVDEFRGYGCNVVFFPDRKRELLKYCKALYKEIKRRKYDVIHVHGNSTLVSIELIIAYITGVKVRIAHSRNTRCEHDTANKLLRPLFNISYNVALACGEDAGKWLFHNRRFTILRNGKELDRFVYSPALRKEMREKLGINEKRAIGFVGNLNEQKNPEFLIDVFLELYQEDKQYVFFVIGDGGKRTQLENLVNERGLTDAVVFTGRISNVSDMLNAMDIMLLPSRFEGLPNVVLEWQTAGLPSFVSDRITSECKVTDLVQFLPIEPHMECVKVWASEIKKIRQKNRLLDSEKACEAMRCSGFDIEENVKILRNLYLKGIIE